MTEVARYIPEGATLVDARGTDAVIYSYTSRDGKTAAIGFHGDKKPKSDFHNTYFNEAHREKCINEFIDGRARRAEAVAQRRIDRSKPHDLKVGQIMFSSWGYDQTNIDYYEVVEVVGKNTVRIQSLTQKTDYDSAAMAGMCEPVPGVYEKGSKPMLKRVSAGNYIRLTSFSGASVWDGRPRHYSTYG